MGADPVKQIEGTGKLIFGDQRVEGVQYRLFETVNRDQHDTLGLLTGGDSAFELASRAKAVFLEIKTGERLPITIRSHDFRAAEIRVNAPLPETPRTRRDDNVRRP
jgi:hypothetical protein